VHYDTSVKDYRTVNGEACIEWDTYFYAVPGEYMGKSCIVRQRENQIIIYNPSHEQFNSYPLAEKGREDKYIGRRPGTTRASSDTSTTEVVRRLEEMGSIMPEYIEQVKKHKPGSYRSHLRRVLSLKVNYHSDDIIMAVRRGLKYKVYEAGSIENFLAVNASKKNEIRLFPNKTDKDEKSDDRSVY